MSIILIIEDDAIMLNAIRHILTKSGYEVITAKNGKEAIEKIDTTQYDVVITDIMMPYNNGLELVSKLRSDINKQHIIIIVISYIGNDETIMEAIRLGADDYLRKPIIASELLIRIKNLLNRPNNQKLVTKKK